MTNLPQKQDFTSILLTGDDGDEIPKRPATDTFRVIVKKCQDMIQEKLDSGQQLGIRQGDTEAIDNARTIIFAFIEQLYLAYTTESKPQYEWPKGSIDELTERVFRMIYSLGPIDVLLEDPEVEDIAVNGSNEVMVRTASGWQKMPDRLMADMQMDADHLTFMFNQAISASGQAAGPLTPIIDDQLPSGDRISIIAEPVASDDAPIVVIRRHRPVSFTSTDFLERPVQTYPPKSAQIPSYIDGWNPDALMTPSSMKLLHMAVHSGLNILLLGKTGVGKTSFLSMLGRFIPYDRRVLVLEDTRELNLRPGDNPENCIYIVSLKKRLEGGIEITMDDLIKAALRQRPDHLVLGEARGAEMWSLLNAMQTGHGGNLTSVHAISAKDLVERVRNMIYLAGVKMEAQDVSRLLGSSFHLVITLLITWDGRRYVSEIASFTGELDGNQPKYDYLFLGGPERDYRLELASEDCALQPYFEAQGLSYADVVNVAKQEKTLLRAK